MDKRTFKICEAVALGLTHYYMGPHDKLDVSGTSPFDYARSMNVNKMMRAPNRKGSLRKKK